MEQCGQGKSAKWMRNFGRSIGSKGRMRLGRRGAPGQEGRVCGVCVLLRVRAAGALRKRRRCWPRERPAVSPEPVACGAQAAACVWTH